MDNETIGRLAVFGIGFTGVIVATTMLWGGWSALLAGSILILIAPLMRRS